jgi:DNA-binding LacI/PurR family transcriptional regulator
MSRSDHDPAGSPRIRPTHPVRLEDVAAAAGVSRTSASRVMLGQGKVSAETRRRVQAVAADLGYIPNTAASELASGGSSTVGLLLRNAANPAYGLLFTELQKAAHAAGITLVSMTIDDDMDGTEQVDSLHRLMGMRVAGLIVATGGVSTEQLMPFLGRIPIIRAARPDSSGLIHAVSYDHDDTGRQLARHVLGLGHTDVIVQVARPEYSLPEHLRSVAMVDELELAGATVHRHEYWDGNESHAESIDLVRRGRATAIMVPQDARQLELIRELHARGMSTPGDVSSTGSDGVMPGIDLLGLTTVRIPVEALARRVIEHVAILIGLRTSSADGDHAVIDEQLPGTLLTGRTAAPLR